MIRYASQNYEEKSMARARLNDAPVSQKVAIEICNMLRYKPTKKAKMMLEEVLVKKRAVPYRRFNMDLGHKRGIGPGRYPEKASTVMLSLIKLAEANAQNKGLGDNLIITHLAAHRGSSQWRHGRQSRRKMKLSHIEIVVSEKEAKKTAEKPAKEKTKEASKPEEKKTEKEAASAAIHQIYAQAKETEKKVEESEKAAVKKTKTAKPKTGAKKE